MESCLLEDARFYGIFSKMTPTPEQNLDRDAPLPLGEPDLAAWAERIAANSGPGKGTLWYGAALFWLVVACIVAARVMFLDLGNFRSATASTAAPSILAGSASSSPQGAKL
jgi:hypothetical protein